MLRTEQKVQTADESTAENGTGDTWSHLARHPRFLSEWEDHCMRFDARNEGSKDPQIETIDLSTIYLAAVGGVGIYNKAPVQLLQFPDFVNAIKIAVNKLFRTITAEVKTEVTAVVNHCCRFYSYLMSQGVYRLSHVDRDITQLYLHRVLQLGWWKANRYNITLRRVLRQLRSKPEACDELLGLSQNNKFLTLNIPALERISGLRIPGHLVPQWFYKIFGEIHRNPKPFKTSGTAKIEPSHSSCQVVFSAINLLFFRIPGFDALSFKPYPRPGSIADKFFGRPSSRDDRTQNLSIETAVRIVSEAQRWLYDYGPSIISMVRQIRVTLESLPPSSIPHGNYYARSLNAVCEEVFREFQAKHNVPIDGTFRQVFSDASVRALVSTYQTAMFFNIVACHGRRRKEVTGHSTDYGLYFGCLRQVADGAPDYKIDIYIEKTLRGYAEYWCSEVVAESIMGLEELSQLFRPLHSPLKQYEDDIELARTDKLFRSRSVTIQGFSTNRYQEFDLPGRAKLFLQLAKVDPTEIFGRNRNTFRRFYCLIFVNRYDNPVLAALQQHLDHSSSLHTSIYGLDPHGRPGDKKAAQMYRRLKQEEVELQSTFNEVRDEYLEQKITQLLRGEDIGGLFPRLVLKLVKRLSADATFAASPPEVKAHLVRVRLRGRGYEVNEKDNGVCMAGKATHTRRNSNCYEDSETHPERAGPKMCKNCIHLMTTEGYHKHLENERDCLILEAKDTSLPRAVRVGITKDAQEISDFLETDCAVATQNKHIVLNLIEFWNAHLGAT